MRISRNLANGSTAHDPKPWISRDQLHATKIVQGPSHHRCSRILSQLDQIPGYVLKCQQRAIVETSKITRKNLV